MIVAPLTKSPSMQQAIENKRNLKNRGWVRKHAKIDTKLEIVNAAGKLFADKGYDSTSVVDIAKAVNIKDASIYNHFKSKQDILHAFLCRVLESLVEDCFAAQARLRDKSPESRLKRFVEVHVGFLVENIDVTPMLDTYSYRSVKLLSESQSEVLKQHQRKLYNLLKEILAAGKERGDFSIEDLTLTTFTILGSIEHLVYWYDPSGRLSKRALQKKLAEHALQTVKRQAAATTSR